MRVMGIDAGFNLGYGVLGDNKPVRAGSLRIEGTSILMGVAGRSCDRTVRELIQDHRPNVIVFASPFMARLVTPTQLRPIMSWPTIIEMICVELRIGCFEFDESRARARFLGKGNLPSKSKAIKAAVMQAVRDRGWPCPDNHAGDALCIAAYALDVLEPAGAHRTTPLFQAAAPIRRVRIARRR